MELEKSGRKENERKIVLHYCSSTILEFLIFLHLSLRIKQWKRIFLLFLSFFFFSLFTPEERKGGEDKIKRKAFSLIWSKKKNNKIKHPALWIFLQKKVRYVEAPTLPPILKNTLELYWQNIPPAGTPTNRRKLLKLSKPHLYDWNDSNASA